MNSQNAPFKPFKRSRLAFLVFLLGMFFFMPMLFADTYQAWVSRAFNPAEQADPTISGETADPAGDGIPNLLKYAFGIEPHTSGVKQMPKAAFVTWNGESYFTISYQVNASDPPADIYYMPEISTDLKNWSHDSEALEFFDVEPLASNPDYNMVTYASLAPVSQTPMQFMRVSVLDGENIPDAWLLANFGTTAIDLNALAANGSGLTIFQCYLQGVRPQAVAYETGDGGDDGNPANGETLPFGGDTDFAHYAPAPECRYAVIDLSKIGVDVNAEPLSINDNNQILVSGSSLGDSGYGVWNTTSQQVTNIPQTLPANPENPDGPPTLGGALELNNQGEVLVYAFGGYQYTNENGNKSDQDCPALWKETDGTMIYSTTLNLSGGMFLGGLSYYAFNDSGTIVGSQWGLYTNFPDNGQAGNYYCGVEWTAGSPVIVGALMQFADPAQNNGNDLHPFGGVPPYLTTPKAINNNGVIVGYAETGFNVGAKAFYAIPGNPGSGITPVVLPSLPVSGLGDLTTYSATGINNNSVANSGKDYPVPFIIGSESFKNNANGEVSKVPLLWLNTTGTTWVPKLIGPYQTTTDANGNVTVTGTDPATGEATAVNDQGVIIGDFSDTSGNSLGDLWRNGYFHDIQSLTSSWDVTKVNAINNKGYIVGTGTQLDSNGQPTGVTKPILLMPMDTIQVDGFIPQTWVTLPVELPYPYYIYNGNGRKIPLDYSLTTGTAVFLKYSKKLDPAKMFEPFKVRQIVQVCAAPEFDSDGSQEKATEQTTVGETKRYTVSPFYNDPLLPKEKIKPKTGTPDVDTVSVTHPSPWVVVTTLEMKIGDPLALGAAKAGPIHYKLTIKIDRSSPAHPTYTISGNHREFPAHEIYINNQRVYQYDPILNGYGPGRLFIAFPDLQVNKNGTL